MLKMLVVAGLAVIPVTPEIRDPGEQFLAWECYGAIDHYATHGTPRDKAVIALGFHDRRTGKLWGFDPHYCAIKYGILLGTVKAAKDTRWDH